jgi:heme/copper-type cytochrome/quinol oxidase subunit 3
LDDVSGAIVEKKYKEIAKQENKHMDKSRILMLVFVASEAVFFLSLIITFIYYNYHGEHIASSARHLEILKTGIFTILLISSSFTAALAESRFRKNRQGAFYGLLAATIVLGTVFLVGQGMEYYRLISTDITISRDVFGSSFFTLTGFHGLHVLLGLIILAVIFAVVGTGNFKPVEHSAVSSAFIYWHFVDAIWIAVFTVIYVGAYIL